jgi:hypothetical protein
VLSVVPLSANTGETNPVTFGDATAFGGRPRLVGDSFTFSALVSSFFGSSVFDSFRFLLDRLESASSMLAVSITFSSARFDRDSSLTFSVGFSTTGSEVLNKM